MSDDIRLTGPSGPVDETDETYDHNPEDSYTEPRLGRRRQKGPDADSINAQEGMARAPEEVTRGIPAQGPEGGSAEGEAASLWSDAWKELRSNPLFIIAAVVVVVLVVMAAVPQLFTFGLDPRDCNLANSLGRPQSGHPFGYDVQGCDYYANTIYGARVSVIVGIVTSTFTVIIAVIFGSIAGFYGGWIDAVITRITDMIFALPFILGGIILLSVLDSKGVGLVLLILILLGWPTMLRLMRSSVLSVKEEDYVMASRSLGANNLRILRKHVLPNAIAPLVVYATIAAGIFIVGEAALSFLGVGLQLPQISWGLMLSNAQRRIIQAPHLLFFPGVFLSVTVFAFILLGDALRDALDPKGR
jgi:ABC-type dipeptide/oligopeptide/nickel transport system permease subunit